MQMSLGTRLGVAVQMSTHNLCFGPIIRKNIPHLNTRFTM